VSTSGSLLTGRASGTASRRSAAALAEVQVAIAVTAVVVLLLRWRLGRWYESGVLVAAMVGELLVFYSVTATVHRPRPPP